MSEQSPDRRIDLPVFFVPFLVFGDQVWIRQDLILAPDELLCRVGHTFKGAAADGRQDGGAVAGTFLADHGGEGQIQNVCCDRSPEAALGPASADGRGLDLRAKPAGVVQAFPQTEGHAFENCLCHLLPAGIAGQSQKGPPHIGIVVGAALSGQVGSKEDRVLTEMADPGSLNVVVTCLQDIIAPPLVTGRGAEHTAQKMVTSVGVDKVVERDFGMCLKAVTADKQGPGSAERNIAAAGADGAGPHRCRRIVRSSCDDGSAGGKAGVAGGIFSEHADLLPAFMKPWKYILPQVAQMEHVL